MDTSKLRPNFENGFMEISDGENGNKIYTFSTSFFVQWQRPKYLDDTVFEADETMYEDAFLSNYGFLRATCDENGKILAYTRAMPIVPDPFPSHFHLGVWYAFETYNRELIKDFDINVYNGGALDGILCFMDEYARPDSAKWKYNSELNSYDLQTFTGIGSIEHWFLVTDNDITSDYGLHETRTYKFNTNLKEPHPDVVSYVNNQLINAGIKAKDNDLLPKVDAVTKTKDNDLSPKVDAVTKNNDNKLFPKIKNPFQKISLSFRDIFQRRRGS